MKLIILLLSFLCVQLGAEDPLTSNIIAYNAQVETQPLLQSELYKKIKHSLDHGLYRLTQHSLQRQRERRITLPEVIYVLRNGRLEMQKSAYDPAFKTWKYAIRGNTLDHRDVRVIIAFDKQMMLVVTVIDKDN